MALAGSLGPYPQRVIPSPASPDAVQIGPLAIPWDGVGYAVVIGFGAWLTARLARLRGLDTRHIGDALLWVIVAGVIGARLYHVTDQWRLYRILQPTVKPDTLDERRPV